MPPTPTPSPFVVEILDSGSSDLWTTLLPFITLVVGALVAYLFNLLGEQGRARRDDGRRWDDDLRKYTGELIACMREVRKLHSQRHAFLSGNLAGYEQAFVLIPEDKVDLLLAGSTKEEWIAERIASVRHESEWVKERTAKAYAIWTRIEELQTNISLVAPPEVQTALDPLVELSERFLAVPKLDLEELVPESYEEGVETLVKAVKKHLRVKPAPAPN